MWTRKGVIGLAVLVLLALGGVAWGQDIAPNGNGTAPVIVVQPDGGRTEIVLIVAGSLILLLLWLLARANMSLRDMIPWAIARDMAYGIADRAVKELEQRAAQTPGKADDEIAALIRAEVERQLGTRDRPLPPAETSPPAPSP